MKALLIMLLIGICAIGMRSPVIMSTIDMADSAQGPAISASSIKAPVKPQQKPMTVAEFAELSKTDPYAYQKLVNSFRTGDPERDDVDKFMNFLARGKFE